MSKSLTPGELIKRLKTVYGVTTHEDLARRLDVPSRRITDYSAGKGMRFDRTIDLLARAGWLDASAIREASEEGEHDLAPPSDPVAVRLQALEAAVARQTDATTKSLASLTAGIRRLERQLAAQDPPAAAGG